MKKIMNVLSLALVLVFVSSSMHAQAGKTNFSGTWAYNAEKSNTGQNAQGGGGRGFGGGDMVVTQDGNTLTVQTTRPGRDGGSPQTTTMKYTLDGKESANTNPRGGESKSTATWSPDGKSLSIKTARTFDMNGETRTMNSTEVWTLNGTALSVTTSMTTPNGDRTSTRVYDKK